MKHIFTQILIVLCYTTTLFCLDDFYNQIYMHTNSAFDSLSMQQASWHNIHLNKQSQGAALQITSFFHNSMDPSSDDQSIPAHYFLPQGQNQLRIKGSATVNEEGFDRDILAQWLGLSQTTDETVAIQPTMQQYGCTLEYTQDLKRFFDVSFLDRLSLGIQIPLHKITTNLHATANDTILEALNKHNILQWTNDDQESDLFTHAKIQLSTKYCSNNNIQIATNTMVIIPIANHISNQYLFEPRQGYNGHIVTGSNVLFQFPLYQPESKPDAAINWFIGVENKYLVRNHQKRTFDLRNKPFSRYLQLYDLHTNSIIPALPVFTKECVVNPYNIANFTTGVRVKYRKAILEAGYELWGHGSESIEVKADNAWQEGRYGIASIDAAGTPDLTKTASASTINTVINDTATTKIYIKSTDLDMLSAATRTTITHRGYLTIGIQKLHDTKTFAANIGGYLEMAQNNAALSGWGLWAKLCMTF